MYGNRYSYASVFVVGPYRHLHANGCLDLTDKYEGFDPSDTTEAFGVLGAPDNSDEEEAMIDLFQIARSDTPQVDLLPIESEQLEEYVEKFNDLDDVYIGDSTAAKIHRIAILLVGLGCVLIYRPRSRD